MAMYNVDIQIYQEYYMEYHGDLVRHFLLKYWYKVDTKFDDCGTKFEELGTKYNPEVIKYIPL